MTDEQITEERNRQFASWKRHEVTRLLFKRLSAEVEKVQDGLIWDRFDNPDSVKGMARAYLNLISLTQEELFSE